MKFKVAVVQFEITQFDSEANLVKAEEYIQQATAGGADLIVFPEDFVLGPLNGRVNLADFDGVMSNIFKSWPRNMQLILSQAPLLKAMKTGCIILPIILIDMGKFWAATAK